MALEVAMDLTLPHLTQRIVDGGIARHDTSLVVQLGMEMTVVALFALVGGTGCTYFSVLAGQGFGVDLRGALFRKVQSLSFANLDSLQTGSLITRLTSDVSQLQDMVTMMLRVMVRMPLLLLGSLIMGSITCPRLAPVLFVLTPTVIFALSWIIGCSFPLFAQVQRRLDRLNIVMQENLAGVRVVKAFARSEYEQARFAEANSSLAEQNAAAVRLGSLTMPLMMLSVNTGIVLAVWFGGHEVILREIKVGQLIAFISYLMQTLMSLMMASMLVARFSRSEASAVRITEVLNTAPAIVDDAASSKDDTALDVSVRFPQNGGLGGHPEGRRPGRISFENVSFRYNVEDDEPVLRDISFSVEPGETVAILGATGAGKSSLTQLIPRFYDVESGRVALDDFDVRELSQETLRREIGIALQETVLFSGTIRDNIRFGRPEASEVDVALAARLAQADDFIRSFPDGYDTLVGQRGVNLSGGQKQRIAIARALLTNPSVLILDDSTSAVDVMTEARIQDALDVHRRGRSNIIIAQRISAARRADKILVVDDGVVVAEGSHDGLLVTSPVYREIYESQVEAGMGAYGGD